MKDFTYFRILKRTTVVLAVIVLCLEMVACHKKNIVPTSATSLPEETGTTAKKAVTSETETTTESESETTVKPSPTGTTTKTTTNKAVVKTTTSTTVSKLPYLLKVNRTRNIVTVYKQNSNGEYTVPYKAMVCSVGTGGGTPTGTFRTSDKYTWRFLFGDVYGQYATRITGHILFHSVPYYSQNKADLEYLEYNKLGTAASMGCVRLCVRDAKWIYDNCPKGTTVVIYDSSAAEPITPPSPIMIDPSSPNRGWDPTDPDSKNPWRNVTTTTRTTTAATTTTTTTATTTTATSTTTAATTTTTTAATTTTTTAVSTTSENVD